jgi:hypothetical protein
VGVPVMSEEGEGEGFEVELALQLLLKLCSRENINDCKFPKPDQILSFAINQSIRLEPKSSPGMNSLPLLGRKLAENFFVSVSNARARARSL